jgi:hypothetical protein
VPHTSYHFICSFDRHHVDAVEELHDLVRRAVGRALRARAVVAVDVDDQRVVELAQFVDGLDDPADLMVVVGGIGGEDVRPGGYEELLFLITEFGPILSTSFFGQARQLRILRDHAELLLVGEDGLAQLDSSRRRTGACR